MKQYENLYTLAESKKEISYYMDDSGDVFGLKQLPISLITITLEELKEVWEAGRISKHFENNPNALYTDFDSYIQRKGIKTINNG